MTGIGDYSVIADVGQTLIGLLRDKMTPEPIPQPELIGMASPADKGDLALSLYLYSIKENGESRRTSMVDKGGGNLQYPPLSLDLFYLLTAHSNADPQFRVLDEQRIMGKALQVLYDHSILRGANLKGALAAGNEEIRVAMESLSADQLTGFWKFGDAPYKLTVGYRVGPVLLDSTRVKTVARVVEREIQFKDKNGGS